MKLLQLIPEKKLKYLMHAMHLMLIMLILLKCFEIQTRNLIYFNFISFKL